MADPVVHSLNAADNLRGAYYTIHDRVLRALRTQVGDSTRLGETSHDAIALLQAVEQHRERFSAVEYSLIQRNITRMVDDLNQACHRSMDPPSSGPPTIVQRQSVGDRGRPRVEISPLFLSNALQYRGPYSLSKIVGCSARTIRRRALELGLVEPGIPVRGVAVAPDGTIAQTHTTATPPTADLTDEQLDALIASKLQIFPQFGRSMLQGSLRAMGYKVPSARITASYSRVHGAPGRFGQRVIHRKKYAVAGANSLWHHDGQHGLIRYKIVIHCFIDGKPRLVTGIKASNNNRARTVLDLFLYAITRFGTPSRVRGDHGTENVLVAEWMEQHRGLNRGSYVWGRSVHNTRIERLWYDVTHGFGQKWKNFFVDLEANHGLNPSIPAHIWLLHHLFLDAINDDAQEWADTWNNHTMQLRGEPNRTPHEMFFFSMVDDGLRGVSGFEPVHEEVDDIASYGIDWEVADNPHYVNHLMTHNPHERSDNPFVVGPATLSDVPCEPPECPLSPDAVRLMDAELREYPYADTRDMGVRTLLWEAALQSCTRLYNN